jgi:hypothetical protein
MDTFWTIIGKIALGSGALLTVLKIYQMLRPKKSSLNATVQHNYVDWPEFIHKTAHAMRVITNSWEFKDDIAADLDYNDQKKVKQKLDKYLAELDGYTFAQNLSDHGHMLKIAVSNNGATTCEDVCLNIPNCRSATIYRDGTTTYQSNLTEVIRLGDLRAKDSLRLSVWVIFLSGDWDNRIRLNFKDGIGTVRFLHPAPAWASDLANNWNYRLLSFFAFLTLIFSICLLIVSFATHKSKNKHSGEGTTATNTIAVVHEGKQAPATSRAETER